MPSPTGLWALADRRPDRAIHRLQKWRLAVELDSGGIDRRASLQITQPTRY
jgi:hypothetical protein